MSEFQVRRDDFTAHRVVATPTAGNRGELGDGEIEVAIDRFAFTANNISYAAAGDILGYWQFFPPTDADPAQWGVIPVWGFADVVASNVDTVPVGDRLFGYFPPANSLRMTPTQVTEQRLFDGAPHRAKLPPAYNQYSRVLAEPGYDRANDDERMLLWPLYITSFCIWDALRDKDWYGAEQIVLVSASSKTAIGLAYALADDNDAPPVVAITSERNLDMVDRIGVYDETVTYDRIDDLDPARATVVVDMAGNGEVLERLAAHFGERLTYCIRVGLTHWTQQNPKVQALRGRSEFFFAPSHIGQRTQEEGAQQFMHRFSTFMQRSASASRDWLTFDGIAGLEAFSAIYPDVCAGRIAPDRGLIITP